MHVDLSCAIRGCINLSKPLIEKLQVNILLLFQIESHLVSEEGLGNHLSLCSIVWRVFASQEAAIHNDFGDDAAKHISVDLLVPHGHQVLHHLRIGNHKVELEEESQANNGQVSSIKSILAIDLLGNLVNTILES